METTATLPRELHQVLKAVANAAGVRYELMFRLGTERRDVGMLANLLDLDQPTVSKHLAELRKAGVVIATYRDGHRLYELAGNAEMLRGGGGGGGGGGG